MKEYLQNSGIIILILITGNFIAFNIVNIPDQIMVVLVTSALLLYPIIRRPIIGVYAIFILLPFIAHIRRLYYLLYTRPTSDPLIMLTDILVVFVTAGLFLEFREQKEHGWFSTPYARSIIFYFSYLLLRTFILNIKPPTEAILLFKFYGPAVIFFFSGMIFGRQMRHIKAIWYITIMGGFLSSLYAIKQLHIGYSEAERIWFSTIEFSTLIIKGVARPFSFFQAPVVLADYLQLALIGILMAFTWTKGRHRYLLFIPLPFLSYAILITSVRSSWIGFLATIILWPLFILLKTTRARIFIITLLTLFYVVFNFLADKRDADEKAPIIIGLSLKKSTDSENAVVDMLIKDRAAALYNVMNEHSILSRFKLWKQLFDYSKDPMMAVFGRGTGALKADSLYFTYLAEFGYPGILFITLLLASFIITGFRIIDTSESPDERILASGITILNLVFAVISITGTHIHYPPSDIYFWFFNGVLVFYSVRLKREKQEKES